MDINKPWTVNRTLSQKEKLILYFTAASVGFRVYSGSLDFINETTYPYTTFNGTNICGRMYTSLIEGRQLVGYEELMEELQKKIKENEQINI